MKILSKTTAVAHAPLPVRTANPRAQAGTTQAPPRCLPLAASPGGEGRVLPFVTLVLWVGCALVATLGFALPYPRPRATQPAPPPLQVERLNVELRDEPLPELETSPADPLATPPPVQAIAPPQLPQAAAVALPSPAIVFALPVEGPVRVVEAARAGYSRAEVPASAAATALPVQQLTFGLGAGKQPAPEYPLIAQDAGQEGVVSVRLVVAENGRVTAAEAVAPSPWPLLNDAALRAIRNRWRFPRGEPRAYDVAIRFVLPK